jgi:hypothetical protein
VNARLAGAPRLRAGEGVAEMNAMRLPGVRFEQVRIAVARQAILAGALPALLREWDADAERFRAARVPHLLYR